MRKDVRTERRQAASDFLGTTASETVEEREDLVTGPVSAGPGARRRGPGEGLFLDGHVGVDVGVGVGGRARVVLEPGASFRAPCRGRRQAPRFFSVRRGAEGVWGGAVLRTTTRSFPIPTATMSGAAQASAPPGRGRSRTVRG